MRMRATAILAAFVGLALFPGCATITGVATGAFTGAVDAPAEAYRQNREAFLKYPALFGLDVLFLGPVGFASGPAFGLVKGVSLDVQCAIGLMSYGPVFHSYGPASIWRPWTLRWQARNLPAPADPEPH
jgi:hypothetical protein